MLDLVIIGSGPAALSAAIYAGRAGLSTTVFEKGSIGGALAEIALIENYPGFVGSGPDLAKIMRSQATTAGAKVTYGECKHLQKITSPEVGDVFQLQIDDQEILARAVLVATGSEPRRLDFAVKPPVSYCALCDSPLYRDKTIAVVGGGNAAVQESLHLAEMVKSLTLFSRSPLSAEPYLIAKLRALKNVTIHENLAPTPELLAPFAGVFVFIGKRPATAFIDPKLRPADFLDSAGFIVAPDFMSKIPGLFVAGDVRAGSVKQAISSSAEGATAAIAVSHYLRNCD